MEIVPIELLVVVPITHVVIRNRVEYLSEHLCVLSRPRIPKALKCLGQWIDHYLVLWRVEVILIRNPNRFRIGIESLIVLRAKKSQVLSAELSPQSCSEPTNKPRLTIHRRFDGRRVFDDDRNFGVVVS
jgi:hypothetical protein